MLVFYCSFLFLGRLSFKGIFNGLITNLVRFQKYLFAGGAVRPSPGAISRGSLEDYRVMNPERADYKRYKVKLF